MGALDRSMTDSPIGRTEAAASRRRATLLAVVTAITAIAATVAVTAAITLNSSYLAPTSVIGLALIVALAIAATMQQNRSARAALDLEAQNASLLAASEEAATTNITRARFIADVSHDLRQPLHALGLFLDALERRVTPGEGEKILARTRDASNLLSRAFNALIDLTRVEADALIPEVELFAIDDLLIRLEEESAAVASAAGLDLRVIHSHAHVIADERIVGHMLRTLLANALDSGPGRLLLGARQRHDRLWIELHCSSPGKAIAKWDLLRAATPTPTATRNAEQLDLLVARRLADLMGLELSVVAKADRGIAIGIALPKAMDGSATPLRNRSILLIADDPPRRQAGASALACAGAIVHVACNLRQADHAAHSNRFELLVTDLALDDAVARDAHAKLTASVPSLPNRTLPEKLVSAAAALLQT